MKIRGVNFENYTWFSETVFAENNFNIDVEWMKVIYIHRLYVDRYKMVTFCHNIHNILIL